MDFGTAPTDDVYARLDHGVATITLNRPSRLNALSQAMIEGFARLIPLLDQCEDVRVIVVRGAGRAFCAGGDVKEFEVENVEGSGATRVDQKALELQVAAQEATVGALYRSRKLVLAVIDGPVAGAGLGFALAADVRLGTDRTVMATAFLGVALPGDFGVTWLLRSIVGPARARDMLLLNRKLGAEDCLNYGLVNRLVPHRDVDAATQELAQALAAAPPLAVGHMKQNLLTADHASLDEAMAVEVLRHQQCSISDDHVEAVSAFAERSRTRHGASSPRHNF